MVQLRSGKLATVDGPVPAPAAAAVVATAPYNKATTVPWVGITYMVLLALQYGLQPILTSRYTPPTVNKVCVPSSRYHCTPPSLARPLSLSARSIRT
jgi:hypothetical protein